MAAAPSATDHPPGVKGTKPEVLALSCTNNGGAGRTDIITFDPSARTLTWAQHPESPLHIKSIQKTKTGYVLRLPDMATNSNLVVYINGKDSRLEVHDGNYTEKDPCHVISDFHQPTYPESVATAPAAAATKQVKNGDDEAGGPQATQAMHHDEAGTVTYRGQVKGLKNFSLKIGPAHEGKSWVAVYVGANGCLGDIAGHATVRGDILELTRDDDGNDCRLTVHRSASGATITEGNCTLGHGTACSFDTLGTTLRPVAGVKSGDAARPLNQYRLRQEVWMGAAQDRLSELHLACGDSALAFTFYLEGYKGHALNKVKDIKQGFVIEIGHSSGDNPEFPLFLYMTPADDGFVQEQSWNFTDGEASAFLDAFGQDGHLSLQTGKGVEIAAWTLKDTAQFRESMRKVCNL